VLRTHVVSASDNYDATDDLAWLLATCPDPTIRDGPKALTLAQEAVEATGRRKPELLDSLAAANAEAGDFATAVKVEKEAIATGLDPYTTKVFTSHLNLYQIHKAVRIP
jgi:hypothetical protein